MPAGRPLLYKTADELQQKVDEYFAQCDEKDEPYTIEGLAIHLGMSRYSIKSYGDREEFFHVIKSAREKCEGNLVKQALNGKVNTTMAIFVLKNDYGWRDQSQLDINADVKQDIIIDIEGIPDDEDFDS